MPYSVRAEILPVLFSVVIVPPFSIPSPRVEIVPLLFSVVILPVLSIPTPWVVLIEPPLLTVKLHSLYEFA